MVSEIRIKKTPKTKAHLAIADPFMPTAIPNDKQEISK